LDGESIPELVTENNYQNIKDTEPIIIVGFGPAGMFAAFKAIELGLKPIVLERGKDVRSRRRDLAAINKEQIVNPESNYCFGEGGAGTYSDGKLYTALKNVVIKCHISNISCSRCSRRYYGRCSPTYWHQQITQRSNCH